MVDHIGKTLELARRQKNLSIEDVARVTRIRPDRVVDLEKGEYGNFPNLAYARSFLLLYAKYLGIDLRNVSSSFERQNQFGVDDYEYLTNTPQARPSITIRPARSMLPYAVIVATLILAGLVAYVLISAQRLGNLEGLAGRMDAANAPAAGQIAGAEKQPPAAAEASEKPQSAASPVPVIDSEVVLEPVRKTWVRIHGKNRDVLFEDFLYPDAQPLTLHGTRFYIEADAGGANVKITRNGVLLTYAAPGIAVD